MLVALLHSENIFLIFQLFLASHIIRNNKYNKAITVKLKSLSFSFLFVIGFTFLWLAMLFDTTLQSIHHRTCEFCEVKKQIII